MRGVSMVTLVAVLTLGLGGTGGLVAPRPLGAEPTKYCGDRIGEAEDTLKEVEGAMDRVSDAQDKSDLQAWVAQAKTHIASAKAAAQEQDCVTQVELAKTLTQDALFLAAQTK
jgi:hypothetical protein